MTYQIEIITKIVNRPFHFLTTPATYCRINNNIRKIADRRGWAARHAAPPVRPGKGKEIEIDRVQDRVAVSVRFDAGVRLYRALQSGRHRGAHGAELYLPRLHF